MLDQSGDTYLPTQMWTCDVCGLVRYEPATAAHWRPFDEPRPTAAAPSVLQEPPLLAA